MSPRLPSRASPMLSPPPTSHLSPKIEPIPIPGQHNRRRPAPLRHTTSGSSTGGGLARDGHASALRLPSLPRFHPANFPSQHTSVATTPATGPSTPFQHQPPPPLSPHALQRQYSDAQRQLYLYQREILNQARYARVPVSSQKPISPTLKPLAGSPGPVTPLELETEDGYLLAGQKHNASPGGSPLNEATKGEIVDSLILKEARRRGDAISPIAR